MAVSPAMTQAEGILRPKFFEAQDRGEIPRDCEFRLGFVLTGDGNRRYFCIGSDGKELPQLGDVELVPTICD